MSGHPDLVKWHQHRLACRACKSHVSGSRVIEEPCLTGDPLLKAAQFAADDRARQDRRARTLRR